MKTKAMSGFVAVAAVSLMSTAAVAGSPSGAISQTTTAGSYSVTLKVLPAESFTGPDAEMAWDGGAEPVDLRGAVKPNHHMVVFVKKDGQPVERASVTIRYRLADEEDSRWMDLPVARMHVAGKGPATTHYGNNAWLAPGRYQVEVTVNGSAPASFTFTLKAAG